MRSIWQSGSQTQTQVWRYFTTSRYIELIKTSALYFASARQFEDRFEGCVAVQSPEYKIDSRYSQYEGSESAFRELTRLTKISCWHCADFESDAMWKLYADFHKGVAIQSTSKLLSEAIVPFRLRPEYGIEDIWEGEVRYVDFSKERLRESMEKRFFYKHKAFAWEREYRMAISLRTAEENGVSVPKGGVKVLTKLAHFIQKIILGPYLSDEDRRLIISTTAEAGLDVKLEDSTLLFTPRYH